MPSSVRYGHDRRAVRTDRHVGFALRGESISSSDEVITDCLIGERAAVTWFVLTQLLGDDAVRNDDGSRTEWGDMIGSPIECGT